MNKKYIINSKEVADMIETKHKNLLTTIRNILKKTNNIGEFIEDCYYELTNNGGYKKHPCLKITLDGVKMILDNKRKAPKMQPLYDFYNQYSNENHKVILASRFEDDFFSKLKIQLEAMNIKIELQKHVKIKNKNYRLDGYLPKYNLAIEYDEEHHKFNKKDDLKREKDIRGILDCDFIRLDYKENDNYNIGLIMKELIR